MLPRLVLLNILACLPYSRKSCLIPTIICCHALKDAILGDDEFDVDVGDDFVGECFVINHCNTHGMPHKKPSTFINRMPQQGMA